MPRQRSGAYAHDSPKAIRFCEEYLEDLNGAAAARRAGYSPKTAKQAAHTLLQLPEIQQRIKAMMDARSERTGVTADRVLEELAAIAFADPNDLVSWRRRCCRHCFGVNFDFQETERERAIRLQAWQKAKDRRPDDVFDERGGTGWDPRRDPNPGCAVCFGEGAPELFLADTTAVQSNARKLYAGVKQTKDGLEVKMHDKSAALIAIGKHLGMFTDRVDHTTGGKPLPPTAITVTLVKPSP